MKECLASIKGRSGLCRHFFFQHIRDVIKIEGEETSRCRLCGMFIPKAMVAKHRASNICKVGQDREKKRRQIESKNKATRQFTVEGTPIENVREFKYLGRWLHEEDDDLPAVQANIKKASARWAMVA